MLLFGSTKFFNIFFEMISTADRNRTITSVGTCNLGDRWKLVNNLLTFLRNGWAASKDP